MRLDRIATIAAAIFLSGSAFAQSVTVGSPPAASPGDTVTVTLDWTDVSNSVSGIAFSVVFDQTNIASIDLTNCLAGVSGFTQCSANANGFNVGAADTSVFGDISLGSFDVTLSASAPPGTIPVMIENEDYSDSSANQVTPLPSTDGQILIEATPGEGFYSSTPAPGETLEFGVSVVGTAATPIDTLNVANLSPDTTFEITEFAMTSGPAGVLPPFPAVPQTIAAGGNADQPISCTPSQRGDNGGTFTVTHDSAGGATSPVSYGFACVGLSPNVNVPAGPVTISGLTVDPNPLTGTFDVTNPNDDGFTSDAMNVTSAAAGDAAISVTPAGPLTIAKDGMQTFTVSCDNSADGNFTSTITIQWDDPLSGGTASDTIDATCDVSNAVASFDSEPTAPGPLDFEDEFGPVTNGTTSDPLGIDVFNDGVGPAPDSNLTISKIATDDAQFAATLANAGPFEVGDKADGTSDIEVTCTPDAGAGAITGTLTVTHDGDDSPTLFDLTCQGESDGTFASDPGPGGTVNLGAVLPQNTTPERFIEFSNNGTVDDITVFCPVTDTAGVFTFMPDPIEFTIVPGGTESAGFQCTPPTIDTFSATVACSIGGDPDIQTADFTVLCQGRPMVVPTMSRWGLVIMSLTLLLVAGFAGRRMLA